MQWYLNNVRRRFRESHSTSKTLPEQIPNSAPLMVLTTTSIPSFKSKPDVPKKYLLPTGLNLTLIAFNLSHPKIN